MRIRKRVIDAPQAVDPGIVIRHDTEEPADQAHDQSLDQGKCHGVALDCAISEAETIEEKAGGRKKKRNMGEISVEFSLMEKATEASVEYVINESLR